MREKAEGPGVVERPGEEIWRCVWVGRYKVERVKSKNSESRIFIFLCSLFKCGTFR